MKPIAQTFYINEPENGVPGVYATSVELFFKSKSPTFGLQIQIRQTENGEPTKFIVPHSDITLPSSSVNVSDDASVGTKFTFKSPLFLLSATSYAIIIIPVGGNPEYQIWTAELNGTDVTTNSPIKTNNDTGTLFLSSNDIQFTSILTEDIKFKINIANFKTNFGKAVFKPTDTDYIKGKDKIGNFNPNEWTYVSNSVYNFARLTYSSNTGAFQTGELVYQSNSTVNAFAKGIVYSANLSTIKITNTNGTWITGQLKGATSGSNATITVVAATTSTIENSNTITVPFTNSFSTNELLFVGKNDRSYIQLLRVKTVLSGTTLQLSNPVSFTESDALWGRVRGDGALYGLMKVVDDPLNPDRVNVLLNDVTSNTSLNFGKSVGSFLIGSVTGSSIRVGSLYNSSYDTIVPEFAEANPGDTETVWSFIGAASSDKSMDSNPILLVNNVEKELYDYSRSLMSRSNEYNNLPAGRKGDSTIEIYADMYTANNMISPVIDYAKHRATFLSNYIVPESELKGYKILLENNVFVVGDNVMQKNVASSFIGGTATVNYSFQNYIIVSNVVGRFNNVLDIQLASDITVNTNVIEAGYFNENLTNSNNPSSSRYISKNVILAEGQDAEDIKIYLTAYRPATTDFLVYAKFEHREDPQKFSSKHWSYLQQTSSAALLSSTVNKSDYVEIEYGLPKSEMLFANSCSCNSTSTIATITSTEQINQYDFVYFDDTASDKFFVANVLKLGTDNKSIYLVETPPFNIANAAFGIIPGIQSRASAFIYANNNNILRYCSNNYTVYDSYKNFAVKIVPVADTTSIIPRAKDMRAIALQV